MYSQSLSMKLKARQHNGFYPIFVEAENDDIVYDFLESNNDIELMSKHTNYYIMRASLKTIGNLYKQDGIVRVEDGLYDMRVLGDSSRIFSHVDSVHEGMSPLNIPYTGRNVVVGIIDLGTDFTHPDFTLNNLGTRIIYLWDQRADTLPPENYSYGQEWDKNDIDNGLCTHYSYNSYGHGTGSAGIACGNGRVLKQFTGMAPESDIIPVSIRVDNLWMQGIADGIEYIFDKAKQINKPAVINISVGGYDGSHDGTDIATRIIESKITDRGQVVVASAGNGGELPQHISAAPDLDTFFTDFKYNNWIGGAYFNFWADIDKVDNLLVGVREDSSDFLTPKSNAEFFDIKSTLLDSTIINGFHEDVIILYDDNNNRRAILRLFAQKQEEVINVQFFVDSIEDNQSYWRFYLTGQGEVDMWVHPSLQYTSGVAYTNVPDSNVYTEFKNYLYPDVQKSIVSGFQCSDKIITVGNYVNKYGVQDIDGNYSPLGGVVGGIAGDCSRGPTRDGRLKPEICAPGSATLAANDTLHRLANLGNANRRKRFAKTGMYSAYGGTSIASPAVAGIIALNLEREPRFNFAEIENIITMTAKKDSFTSMITNNTYGHGKINAMQSVLYPITYSCHDSSALNYDTAGMFHDSTLCIEKRYGCMDSSALNYDSTANVSNDSCEYKLPSSDIDDLGNHNYRLFMNNSDQKLYIYMESFSKTEMRLYNVSGQLILNIDFEKNTVIDMKNFGTGIYFIDLFNEGKREKTKVFLN